MPARSPRDAGTQGAAVGTRAGPTGPFSRGALSPHPPSGRGQGSGVSARAVCPTCCAPHMLRAPLAAHPTCCMPHTAARPTCCVPHLLCAPPARPTCCAPHTAVRPTCCGCVVSFDPTAALSLWFPSDLPFADGETAAQRGAVISPRSHALVRAGVGPIPGLHAGSEEGSLRSRLGKSLEKPPCGWGGVSLQKALSLSLAPDPPAEGPWGGSLTPPSPPSAGRGVRTTGSCQAPSRPVLSTRHRVTATVPVGLRARCSHAWETGVFRLLSEFSSERSTSGVPGPTAAPKLALGRNEGSTSRWEGLERGVPAPQRPAPAGLRRR